MLRMNRGTAEVPIILRTGAVTHVRETEDHLMTMKVEVVYKPFQIDHLLGVIQRVLTAEGDMVPTHSRAPRRDVPDLRPRPGRMVWRAHPGPPPVWRNRRSGRGE